MSDLSFTPPAVLETQPELSEEEQKVVDAANAAREKAEQAGTSQQEAVLWKENSS